MADDQIQVSITADASGFTETLQTAAAAVQVSFAGLQQTTQAINVQINTLTTNAQKKLTAAQQVTKDWVASFDGLDKAFTQSLNGMILGTTTWQKTVRKLSQMALSDLLNLSEKTLAGWLQSETAKTAAVATGTAERNALESAGQSQGIAQMVMNALKAITTSAAQAAASTYSSVSAIPYVGWILAPPAAAAAFAAVLAFGSKLPSGAGGIWNVPSDTMAFIHKQESVLPANVAQPMRDFFAGGGPAGQGSSGGDSYAITIQAIDAQSGAQFLMNNAGVIAQGLARELRNGNTALRGAMK
jgi:hypothetical protein